MILGSSASSETPSRGLVGEVDRLLALVLAEVVDRQVHDDPVEPRIEGRLALELVEVPVGLDEGVLDHVEGVVLVADHAERQA
jgi:hypothetical protein